MRISLGLLATASAAAARSIPHPPQSGRANCVQSIVPVHASATNFNLTGLDPTKPVPLKADVPVSGRFTVEVHFCTPTARRAAHADTLLVMAPGATYNTLYWDLPLQPETYSFVRLANSQGFATLSIARVGDGLSSRPDPINVLQLPIQVAAQVKILKLAREGKIPGFRGRFRNIVGIGHSLSSAILNGVIVEAPQVLDAAIFTGVPGDVKYGHADPSNMLFPTTGFGFIPANEAGIPRFRNLPDGYLTTQNITSRTVFYGPPGTFDPDVLAFDEAHKDTVSIGEFNTLFTSSVAAPRFRGPVLTFYPNARSVEFGKCLQRSRCSYLLTFLVAVIQGSGHDLNLHLTAPGFFQTLIFWIDRHGF
ncbi:hypothetical protein AURDEDRAFT_56385 [Auricularia subglabra TFB-10046 SS5]|nr:hypothetical protein AURDEDRAFT_56385 [Auricularia subglabra TFB-10046 SS5]